MLDFLIRYHNRLADALIRHLFILLLTIPLSTAAALGITVLINGKKRVSALVLRILGALYAVPSLALFAILIPFLGIGLQTAVFALVLYNQFLLIRNFTAGLDAVNPALVEAGRGMGMTNLQILFFLKIPLAFPAFMAGIRLAVISTIGIGTIAAVINAGGIGAILFDGLRTVNAVKILWGTILAGGLACAANALLAGAERVLRKKLFLEEL
jgi:osmoprotectant transport system permease protein